MSVNISVSDDTHEYCGTILKKLFKSGINCRLTETISVVDNSVEQGCMITLNKEYSDKEKLKKVWGIIKPGYNCSHLKIDGIFDGCIYNYIHDDFCPGG